MKNNRTTSIVISAMIVLLCTLANACARDNENEVSSGDYHFTAKVNGVNFSSIDDEMLAVSQDEYLIISGATQNQQEVITFQFFDFPGTTGTYTIGNGQYETHCFYSDDTQSFFIFDDDPKSSGTLIITDIGTNSIKGTFSFTGVTNEGTATTEVTNGSFYVPMLVSR